MKKSFEMFVENSKQAIKYWWLLLILGLAMLIIGIVVFVYPAESYIGMTVIFGWLILFSGIAQIVLYITNKHFITARGWMLAGGIIETLLGLILIFSIVYAATVLPIFLGFWLLFRSFSMIGLGSDMNAMKMPGGWWTIFMAILLMISSLIILFHPVIGVGALVIWVGISLVFAGVLAILFAMQLRNSHKALK